MGPALALIGISILVMRLAGFTFIKLLQIFAFLAKAPAFPPKQQLLIINGKPIVVDSKLLRQSGLTAQQINAFAFAQLAAGGKGGKVVERDLTKNEHDTAAYLRSMGFSLKVAEKAARRAYEENPTATIDQLVVKGLQYSKELG